MTGYEALKDELIKRGCTKTQAESKVVAVLMDILANNTDIKTVNEDLLENERMIEQKERKLKIEKADLDRMKDWNKGWQKELERREKKVSEQKEEIIGYIDRFNESLKVCETESGRDTMRRAQLFANSVRNETKYDNTAYIVGLAAILSEGKISAIEEIKGINSDLVKIPDWGGAMRV